jgi:hypothetical protein
MVAVINKSKPDQRILLACAGRVLIKDVLQFELLVLLKNDRATYGSQGQEKFC